MVKGRVSFANGTKGGRTLKKKERRPGAFGQNCPAFFLLALGNRGGVLRAPAALGRRPWSSAAARDRGKRERAAPGTDSQPQPGQGRSRVTWPRRPSANGRRRPWAGVQRRGGEQKGGEKHHGAPGTRFTCSPWVVASCGWLSTAAGGAWRQWGWRRRCKLG